MTVSEMEKMMESMTDYTAEKLSEEESNKKKIELKSTLKRFNDMLHSRNFARKCKREAKVYGVNEKFIRNLYAQKILNGLADGVGMATETFGEAFNYLIRFISYVLQGVADFTVSSLNKVINVITIRKEVVL